MSSTLLLSLSTSESTTTDNFMADCKEHSKLKGNFLEQCSQQVEKSVQELLQLLTENALLPVSLETDAHDKAQLKKGPFNNTITLDK